MGRHFGFTLSSIVALFAALMLALAVSTGHGRPLPRTQALAGQGAGFAIGDEDAAVAPATSAPARLNAEDRELLAQALREGEREMAIARLALQRSRSASLRSIAGQLLGAREQVQTELRRLAMANAVDMTLFEGADYDGAASEPPGSLRDGFDLAWLNQMIDLRRRAIELYERVQRQSADARLRSLAAGILPDLKANLLVLQSAGGARYFAMT